MESDDDASSDGGLGRRGGRKQRRKHGGRPLLRLEAASSEGEDSGWQNRPALDGRATSALGSSRPATGKMWQPAPAQQASTSVRLPALQKPLEVLRSAEPPNLGAGHGLALQPAMPGGSSWTVLPLAVTLQGPEPGTDPGGQLPTTTVLPPLPERPVAFHIIGSRGGPDQLLGEIETGTLGSRRHSLRCRLGG